MTVAAGTFAQTLAQQHYPDIHPLMAALQFADSYTRAQALLDLYDATHIVPRDEWFRTLGAEWSICDNLGAYVGAFSAILNAATPDERRLMMTDEERDALAALPDEITVYRGCYAFNSDGLSWSLSRDTAEKFVTTYARYAHRDHAPLLLTGRVHKSACVLMLSRSEQEIITTRARTIFMDEVAPAQEAA